MTARRTTASVLAGFAVGGVFGWSSAPKPVGSDTPQAGVQSGRSTTTPEQRPVARACREATSAAVAEAERHCRFELYLLGVAEPIAWSSDTDRANAEQDLRRRVDDARRSCPHLGDAAVLLACDERPCMVVVDDPPPTPDFPDCPLFADLEVASRAWLADGTWRYILADRPQDDLGEAWIRRRTARASALKAEPSHVRR